MIFSNIFHFIFLVLNIFEINQSYTIKEIVIGLASKLHLIENIINAKLAD